MRLNNFGLSDTEGTFAIYKDEETSGLSSLYQRNLSFCNMSLSIKEAAEMKRAKNYIESNGIKKINLVKMDIEGHEISALKGFGEYLNADFIDAIQFEYGGANIDSHTNLMDFYNLLLPRDFIICKVKKHYLEIRDYNPRLDNFVYQNFVAISKKSGFLP
ncbi:MAG: FkbM family methyltransferase [Candidatus Vogelbacteria bacterium]|nr:FkbM family methyltransferase [Candidatus Vogelbacteria bacterium]